MTWRHAHGHDAHRIPRPHRWPWPALAGLAVAVLLNSGCIMTGPGQWIHNGFKVGPNYDRSPAPVAAEWIQANDPSVQNHHLQDWWQVFGDPTLDALIVTAYEQNPTLRIAGTRVLQARAGQAIAVGNIFPQTQQATGSYSRYNLNSNMPLVGPLSKLFPGGERLLPFSNWYYGFNLSWELDLWGRIRRNIESTNASLDASVEDYDAALVTLLADVATNYAQYRVAQQRIKIARDNVRIQEGILALTEEKFRVGTTTRLDVEQARTVLQQTRSTIPALQIQLGQANDTLCILVGFPPRDLEPELGPGPALGSTPMPNTPAWVATGIPADLLRRRPDVRSAERHVAAQSAQIGVAEAALYPTIAINGNLRLGCRGPDQAVRDHELHRIHHSRLQLEHLELRPDPQQRAPPDRTHAGTDCGLSKASAGRRREVQIPLRGFLRAREQAEDLARSVEAARAATQLGVQQYRTGVIDFNRVFNLETTQVQQQDRLAVAAGDIALNLINVYRALGGGWEMRLQEDRRSGEHVAHAALPGMPSAMPAPPAPAPAPPAPGSLPEPLPAPRPVP